MSYKRRARLVATSLSVAMISGCGLVGDALTCTADLRFGLVVTVVDSVTGMPPASALLIARTETAVDSVGPFAPQPVVLNGAPTLQFPAAPERAGVYQLLVRAPGYRDWTRSGVEVTKDGCHVRRTEITARLQPAP